MIAFVTSFHYVDTDSDESVDMENLRNFRHFSLNATKSALSRISPEWSGFKSIPWLHWPTEIPQAQPADWLCFQATCRRATSVAYLAEKPERTAAQGCGIPSEIPQARPAFGASDGSGRMPINVSLTDV